jgi:hypothetical protein
MKRRSTICLLLFVVLLTTITPAMAQPTASPLASPLPEYHTMTTTQAAQPRAASPVNPWAFIFSQSWGHVWHLTP